jgi:hypothetical protein
MSKANMIVSNEQKSREDSNQYFQPNKYTYSRTSTGNKRDLKILQKTEVLDLNLNTDYNERLLDEVGANLREIDRNVSETAISLKGQSDSLKNINGVVDSTEGNIERAKKTINNLSWGQRIQLMLIHFIAILLFVAIVILLVLRIISSKN